MFARDFSLIHHHSLQPWKSLPNHHKANKQVWPQIFPRLLYAEHAKLLLDWFDPWIWLFSEIEYVHPSTKHPEILLAKCPFSRLRLYLKPPPLLLVLRQITGTQHPGPCYQSCLGTLGYIWPFTLMTFQYFKSFGFLKFFPINCLALKDLQFLLFIWGTRCAWIGDIIA